jgi:sulfite exporter TauE/SafE
MTDIAQALTLSAALMAGVAGSAHCLLMCGGLAGALSIPNRTATP